MNTQEFIKKAILKHNDKYDYSKSNYIDSKTKVEIICLKHGSFWQLPSLHAGVRKQGCNKCGCEKNACRSREQLKTLSDFINEANIVHSYKYNYDKTIYNGMRKKVIVICKEHGEFNTIPANHISNKSGCPKCAVIARNNNLKTGFDDFVKQANTIHDNKYQYVDIGGYSNSINHKKTIVKVICDKHGEFIQSRYAHLAGKGCSKCAAESAYKFDNFVLKANEIYGGKYSYIKESYTGCEHTVDVICPEHGVFTVCPKSHIVGAKCKKCKMNLFEKSVYDFLLTIADDEIKLYDRSLVKEIDFLAGNVGIECHGDYWHSYCEKETLDQINMCSYKHDLCHNNNIRLLQIFEHEWNDKRDIVKSILSSCFRKANRIYARKCYIITPSVTQVVSFLNNNHIQGYRSAPYSFGLSYDGELVALLTISKHNKYQYEMMRYCNRLNTVVVGGLSKLMDYFVDKYKPKSMISYANRRYFNGNSYEKVGFVLDGITSPNYMYFKKQKVYSRHKFQKHKLPNVLDVFDQNETESVNMFNNGYRRIWDAGNFRYIKKWS